MPLFELQVTNDELQIEANILLIQQFMLLFFKIKRIITTYIGGVKMGDGGG